MNLDALYLQYRALLLSVAYRMLGSITEAEDIVQDTFLDYYRQQSQADQEYIRNEKAYLIQSVTNRCINLLTSARKRREQYVGPWLPEPEVTNIDQQPEESAVLHEEVSYALLVLMEQLTPMERAVFILRDTLGYDYQEVANLVHKTPVNCRKIYSRVQQKLHADIGVTPVGSELAAQLSASFIAASVSGDFHEFIELLTDDAVLYTDGGGIVRSAIFPILGRQRILAFMEGVWPKGFFGSAHLSASINGRTGTVIIKNQGLAAVVTFQFDLELRKAERIYVVKNPEKLCHVKWNNG
ncbi:RNA polymerase sigma-70 factor [Paenibacillus sp. ACRRX]|uniref:RNA polymerase sigma-70 factor n=1 Tax=Paenibacillus sp. ACRRX TaxID=2918206 RepID=UPI001EF6DE0E|nr:RNA polymerase sigma-70 factor [Paenibacillus sp. ACRRX]MCG7408716.1 RNA polymerase sigma-70 factor [Paenibacillus sp. ACRRX]